MEHTDTESTQLLLEDTVMAFTPVPQQRRRHDGWWPERQAQFIRALEAMGAVGPAVRAVGMSRASAYRLRDRADGKSFAKAWDTALDLGQKRVFGYSMDRALNGTTTIRIHKGGSVSVSGGPDMQLLDAATRDAQSLVRETKETI